jgi:hypothetical protein
MIRAQVEDAAGNLVSTGVYNISFVLVSGVGRLNGVGNGDHECLTAPKGNTIASYFGLARAYVQVAQDCVSTSRDLILAVDKDSNQRTHVVPPQGTCNLDPLVLKATSPGLAPATVSVAVSMDASASPLAVALASSSLAYTFMDGFQG